MRLQISKRGEIKRLTAENTKLSAASVQEIVVVAAAEAAAPSPIHESRDASYLREEKKKKKGGFKAVMEMHFQVFFFPPLFPPTLHPQPLLYLNWEFLVQMAKPEQGFYLTTPLAAMQYLDS